jgi:hypothetical protein
MSPTLSADVVEHEITRTRWRRARQPLLLLDPEADGFATGGLARRVRESSVRLLILPPDPEDIRVEFDERFWAWWQQDRLDPSSGQAMRWWPFHEPTSSAAASFVTRREGVWDSYLAIHRHAGLETELGRECTYSSDGRRAFRLRFMVERVWAALGVYGEVVRRYGLSGPWEVSLALRDTSGAVLGNVARGWSEPGTGLVDVRTCAEPGLLLRREVTEWPDENGTRALALSLGAWVEDSWGYSQRRFLPRTGA